MSGGANKQPFGVERAEESPGFLLWQVTNAWQRIMRATLVPFDLTHVQFVLLASTAWLTRTGGEITQIEIAAHARTDPMMTSQVLRALEAKGFLTRRPHSVDRRAMRIDLTDAGRELVGQSVPAVEAADADFFRALGPDQPVMIAMLQQLAERD